MLQYSSFLGYFYHMNNNESPKNLGHSINHSSTILAKHNSPYKLFSSSLTSQKDSKILILSNKVGFQEIYIIKTESFHQFSVVVKIREEKSYY